MLRELPRLLDLHLGALRPPPTDAHPARLILVATTMWGQALDEEARSIPEGWEVTADARRYREAAVVVFHIPTLGRAPLPAKRPGQLWVAWSMECEVNYQQLRDPAFMRRFDLTMTYRLNADVVTSYLSYYASSANLEQALPAAGLPKVAGNLAVLMISSTIDKSGRLAFATELMRHLPVHSYGKTLRNRTLSRDQGRMTKLDLIGSYTFTLAFENAIGEDYVTEKFYDPLVAGSVPVYLGAPNAAAFAPGEECFIDASAFAHPRRLAEYLLAVAHDDAAYAAFFAWKGRPWRASFQRLLVGQATPPFARLCQVVQSRGELS